MSDKLCLVIDANDGPCVRSLFHAVAGRGWRVVLMRVITPGHLLDGGMYPARLIEKEHGVWCETVLVPGFRRCRRLSERIIRLRRMAIQKKLGKPDAVIYTMPRYHALAAMDEAKPVYFAYDPYKFYHGWDYQATEEQELKMLGSVKAAFAVSGRICDDWMRQAGISAVCIPNAVDSRFVDACRSFRQAANDCQAPGTVVGCIGNINTTYDWPLIGKMADALPSSTFVFVGEITESAPEIEYIKQRKNVRFAGWHPASELPALLSAFDVCLNPLLVNEMNNRRCPLRLYTYLASCKPVVSTAVSEVERLRGYVNIGADHEECIALVRRAAEGGLPADMDARNRFIDINTWDARAAMLLEYLEKL